MKIVHLKNRANNVHNRTVRHVNNPTLSATRRGLQQQEADFHAYILLYLAHIAYQKDNNFQTLTEIRKITFSNKKAPPATRRTFYCYLKRK
jgi:hypothetical protein